MLYGHSFFFLVNPINFLHDCHEWAKRIFLNFTHFHGRQPFWPISQPGLKIHLPLTVLKKIFAENLPTNIRSNIYKIQSAKLPYFQNIQIFSFFNLWYYRKPEITSEAGFWEKSPTTFLIQSHKILKSLSWVIFWTISAQFLDT